MIKRIYCMLIAISISGLFITQAQSFDQSGYQQVKIGDLDLIILTDGYMDFPTVQPFMAPDADSKNVSEILTDNFLPTGNFRLGMNIMLVKKADHLILFDSGTGLGGDETAGKLIGCLKQLGIAPEQITDIVITHAHYDHIGGLLDATGNFIYPNAKYYITEIEYNFWTGENPDFSNSKMFDAEQVKASVQASSQILKTLKPKMQFVKDGETILDCMTLTLAPGHTAGHVITEISSKGESIFHIADIVHYGTLLFPNPQWGTIFDWDFNLGIQTRIKTFEMLNQKKALTFVYHLPYPGVGHIKKTGADSYEWVPKQFVSPAK